MRILRTIVLISGIATLVFFWADHRPHRRRVAVPEPGVVDHGDRRSSSAVPIVLAVVCYFVSANTTRAVLGFYAIAALALTLTYPSGDDERTAARRSSRRGR